MCKKHEQFTQEELIALKNLVLFASVHIGLSDEPLVDVVYEKLEKLTAPE